MPAYRQAGSNNNILRARRQPSREVANFEPSREVANFEPSREDPTMQFLTLYFGSRTSDELLMGFRFDEIDLLSFQPLLQK
ncbi:MAG: hypothetical protein COT91_00985 [Candidatus Doudnabacteria bacterium CG10_big_fil_rev_8_21_14_0_10_41_10]|uniref:Uncharacterized protein n=1 Tax=Candidatus Doudnabacteria bacterium CG10_big_fil_rev_8_21_14_0_10_41_10 TaxID=1974551 RepID=A0A2H0VEH8_9BACT|nr:MAG: hypothetical protein COT91_00985 [Candidatus Doudnabacteria bacterium CG10_big_fil_rev_8_21_14_0_10_41_10]